MNFKASFSKKIQSLKGFYQKNKPFNKNYLFPPGHFYSPIISVDDIKKRQENIWSNERNDEIKGITLQTNEQLNLIKEFEKYYTEIPFSDNKNNKNRYYFKNPFYSYTDAIFLYSMIRKFNPKQIIEVGSGFSSAVMLDINEQFYNNTIQLTFIEPYPDRLEGLLKSSDTKTTTLIKNNVQDVRLDTFEKLNSGDFLFIDSSHVVKTGSDVSHILFEILPRLKSGVIIHFHDIFYPFEYPKEWVFEGRNWNENYFLRAFLMYNNQLEIKLFSNYLHKHHSDVFKNMPLIYKNKGGNIWLQKK